MERWGRQTVVVRVVCGGLVVYVGTEEIGRRRLVFPANIAGDHV
jgi:hypothetical protein